MYCNFSFFLHLYGGNMVITGGYLKRITLDMYDAIQSIAVS